MIFLPQKFKLFTKNPEEEYLAVKHENSTILYISFGKTMAFRKVLENLSDETW